MQQSRTGLLIALLLCVVAIDLLAVFKLTQIRFNDGLEKAFISKSIRYRDYERFLGKFTQSENDLVVLFKARDFADPNDLARIAGFALEAQFVDGVNDVTSVFSLRELWKPDGAARPFLPAVLPPQSELERLLNSLEAHAADGARFVSKDRRLTAVVIALDKSNRNVDKARITIGKLAALAGPALVGSDVRFVMSGVPAIRVESVGGLLRDTTVINVIGLFIGVIVCLAALRNVPLALLTGIPAATALLWSLGTLSMLGYEVNLLTVALPLLVIVLSLSDGLHLSFEVRRQVQNGEPFDSAALRALTRVGPACALASITTAIAFAGLTLSKSELIRDFGEAGCIATMVSLVAVLAVHPLLFAALGRGAPALAAAACAPRRLLAVFDWKILPEAAVARPRLITATALVLLAISAGLYAAIEPAYSLTENLSRSNPAARALDEINRELVPVNTIDIPVEIPKSGATIDAASLARIEAVQRIAVSASNGALAFSVATLVPRVVGESGETRAARLSKLLPLLSDSQRRRVLSSDGQTALVRLHIANHGAAETRDFVARLEAALGETGVSRTTGFAVMSSFVSAEMISDLNFCFLIALAASAVLIAIWFRSLRYGLVALVPNVLPIALVGAWLVLSGRGLQFASGIALTIAFGIALDDTVHVLNRLKLNAPKDAPFDSEAIRLSMEEITPVLVITTAVLSLGLVGTFFSSMAMTAYFGALSIAVLLLAILADLVTLPALLRLLHRPAAASRPAMPYGGLSARISGIFARRENR